MITYTKSHGGVFLIFRIVGTSWPAGMLPALVAAATSLAFGLWDEELDDDMKSNSKFISQPYPFEIFGFLLGFLLTFRTNFAYNRYWEAISGVQAMGSKWMDGALMGITFDASGDNRAPLLYGAQEWLSRQPHAKHAAHGGPCHADFFDELVHICSLLHALALQHLRQDADLDNLGYAPIPGTDDGLQSPTSEISESSCGSGGSGNSPTKNLMSPRPPKQVYANYSPHRVAEVYSQQRLHVLGGVSDAERRVLESFGDEPLSTEARVSMVACWFMRRLLARSKFEQGDSRDTSPPITSRLYQVISDGNLWFSHASKIAITPFPFPYHNLMSILIWIYTFLAPLLVNGCIMETTARFIFSVMAVFPYHALSAVADNLEDPFRPYDVNELPLPELQHSVNLRLLAFGVVPQWDFQAPDNSGAGGHFGGTAPAPDSKRLSVPGPRLNIK